MQVTLDLDGNPFRAAADKMGGSQMTAKVLRSTNGQYFVRVVASNSATLAHSETYVAKSDALNCVRIIAEGGTVQDLT